MKDIKTLLNHKAQLNDRVMAATNIIADYDLRFNSDDLIKAVNRFGYSAHTVQCLMHLLLTTNLRMFYAVIYALIDNKMRINGWCGYLWFPYRPDPWCYDGGSDYNHKIRSDTIASYDGSLGCYHEVPDNTITTIYCALYDYYDFDITNLVLPNEDRIRIQKHIDSKVTYTKKAIKK